MASPFTLWGSLGSFFGGTNVHRDRSLGTANYGISNPLWVDTSTPTSTFVQGGNLTYTIWVAGQDAGGNQNGAVAVGTTTMVFPILTTSGQNGTAAAGIVFSQTNNVQTDGVFWFEGTGVSGSYNIKYQALTNDAGAIATGKSSISLVGSAQTLESAIASPIDFRYANNTSQFVIAYSTGTDASHNIYLQSFNTAGTAISSLVQVGTSTSADYAIRADANGNFWYAHEDNSDSAHAKVMLQSLNASTGALGSAVTLTTDLVNLVNFDARFATNGDGSFLGYVEGYDSVNGHYIELNAFNASFSSLGTGVKLALNSTNQVHIETAQLANGDYVLIYNDATTPGGSTFQTHMLLFDASGNQIGTEQVLSLSNFDRIRNIGNNRVEIDWRSGTGNNFTVVGQIYDVNTTGQILSGTTGNDITAGTAFSDTISTGKGDDVIAGGPGTDTIDGGGGLDRVTYTTTMGSATITHNANGTVTIAGSGFTDTLSNVEIAHFTDGDVSIREAARTDINGSGTSGMILQSGGTVVDWTLSGGAYQSGSVLTTGATGYTVVGSGDLNGDGTADVLLQNGGTIVDWLLTNGSYTTGNVITTGATGFTVKGVGDFNGDGTSDVVLQNGNTIVTWTMKNGTYQAGNVVTTSAGGFTVVGTGDFNGDGTTDLLLQNGGTVAEWFMKNGSYQSGGILSTGAAGYTVVGTGDFNGDGTTDVLLQNGGTVVDWLLSNGAFQSGNVITTGATGFTVVGTGDYNGDGTADIALQNGGTVVDWTMKNGTYLSGNVVTTGATGFAVKA